MRYQLTDFVALERQVGNSSEGVGQKEDAVPLHSVILQLYSHECLVHSIVILLGNEGKVLLAQAQLILRT